MDRDAAGFGAVMVWDDQSDYCKQVEVYLRRYGFEVDSTNDHEKFVEVLAREDDAHDLAIIDLVDESGSQVEIRGIDLAEEVHRIKGEACFIALFTAHAPMLRTKYGGGYEDIVRERGVDLLLDKAKLGIYGSDRARFARKLWTGLVGHRVEQELRRDAALDPRSLIQGVLCSMGRLSEFVAYDEVLRHSQACLDRLYIDRQLSKRLKSFVGVLNRVAGGAAFVTLRDEESGDEFEAQLNPQCFLDNKVALDDQFEMVIQESGSRVELVVSRLERVYPGDAAHKEFDRRWREERHEASGM